MWDIQQKNNNYHNLQLAEEIVAPIQVIKGHKYDMAN